MGLISATYNAKIENIFIKNEKILINSKNGITVLAGGVIGYMQNTNIQNVSVTDLSVSVDDENSTLAIGGLIGNIHGNNVIKNSYVQNIEVNEISSLTIEGIGGIAGATTSNADYKNITNCYAIGNINTTKGNVGGIVGRAESIEISNCISKVNINAQDDNVAGVVGKITAVSTSSQNNIENNFALGNIYSTKLEAEAINRIIGSGETTANNYAYSNQLINGKVLANELGANLISYNEIFTESTYKNFEGQYDLAGLKDGVLPKLLSTTGNLLPNQVDNKLEKEGNIEIESVEAQKTGTNTLEARVNLINPDELSINKIIIGGIDVEITRNTTQNGKTYINIKGKVTKYFDNYRIEKIEYAEKDGTRKTIDVAGKIELQYYKDLYNFDDWQSIDASSYQNYRLMADIDFAGKTNIKDNIQVNRFETDGEVHTLKNINLEYSSSYNGLIKGVKKSLENVNFENITIKNTTNDSNYIGIIVNSNADNIQNINLKNVTINAKGDYIGFISRAEGETILNINMDTINLTGHSLVGALTGHVEVKNIDNIYGTNIHIEATGNQIGGVVGWVQNVANGHMKNVTIEGNSTINSSGSTVGGVIGEKDGASSFNVAYIYARNISVKGKDNVGGIGGLLTDCSNLYAENVTIEGNSYVGGIEGINANPMNSSVKNSTIKATGNYVGAVAGEFDGGINSYNIYAKGCSVEGNSYVGGIAGRFNCKPLYNTYNDSKVIATNHTAGGIIGYLANTNMTAVYNTSKLYNNYAGGTTVTAKANVGGFIGNMADDLYMPETYYYSNYIEAYLNSEDTNTVSLGIGGRQNQNAYLKDTYYYKYSSINGENPNRQNEIFISENAYLLENDLKQQQTYTSKLKWNSSDWNFAVLQNNKYPTFNRGYLGNQEGIDIPKDAEHIIGGAESVEAMEKPEQTFEYAGKQITTYSAYSIIQDTEGNSVKRDVKLYLKEGNLYALSPNINMVEGNFIIDNFNGKEYETVLGTDGKLYDLKEKLTYPDKFKNEDIESIGNNLNNNSHEIDVVYKNGAKVKFNYQTGEIISEETTEESKTGLLEFIQEKLTTEEDAITTNEQAYEDTKELIQKLEEVPVEKAEEIQKNDEQQKNGESKNTNTTNYIATYNITSDSYEIYSEKELLSTAKQTAETENEKIDKSNLSSFYAAQISKAPEKSGKTAIYIIILVIVIALAILMRYNINKGKKNLK